MIAVIKVTPSRAALPTCIAPGADGARIPETRSPSACWHAAGMGVAAQAGRLLGRQGERAVLERLLVAARDGHGAVLVVHGEPGVGKTALLEYGVEVAEGFRVVRTVGVE